MHKRRRFLLPALAKQGINDTVVSVRPMVPPVKDEKVIAIKFEPCVTISTKAVKVIWRNRQTDNGEFNTPPSAGEGGGTKMAYAIV